VRAAVEYLIALGHRRIAIVAWPEESLVGESRLAGYRDALSGAGIPYRSAYVYRGEYDVETGHRALLYWQRLAADERPTAIVTVTDLIAIGVMNEAQRQGLTVGETLSVVGYDDIPLTQYLSPALTTIQQPIPEIGRQIMDMLEALLRGQPIAHKQVMFTPNLIIRQSAGPPR
jgi:DNA-binding LacI/PurR family transcriptional regulator